jgi:WD40 repeat protein
VGVLLALGAGAAAITLSLRASHATAVPVVDDPEPEVAVKDGILPRGDREGEVVAVQFARDGKTVVVVRSGSVVKYDNTTHQPIGLFGPIPRNHCGSVVVYDVTTHEERGESLGGPRVGPFCRSALSPDGQLAVIDKGPWQVGGVSLYDLAAKKELGRLDGTPPQLSSLVFAPDGKTIACADSSRGGKEPKAVLLWEVGTPKPRTTLQDAGSNGLAFSPDSKLVATSGTAADGKSSFVKLWNARSGDTVATLTDKEIAPRQLAFSPDGKKLLVGTNQGIELWDVGSRKRDWVYPSEKDKSRFMDVRPVAYSPDGKLVAAGDYSGQVRVWDAATGEERGSLKVTEAYITALAFAPDSQSLAIGSGHYFNERGTKLKFDGYPARLWKLRK